MISKNLKIWLTGIIYFIIIPLILTVVFLLSDSLKGALLLYPNNPTFISIIGSNYLHTTFPHFISNLIFYLVIMVFIFTFDVLTNRKMLFVNLLLLFIVIPVISSVVNIFIFTDLGTNLSSNGFSAIVAGVFGYLAFSTLHFIREYYGIKFEKSIIQLMWLILYINFLIITLVYGHYLAVILLSALVLFSIFYTSRDIKKIFSLLRKIKRSARVTIFVSLYLCLCVGVIGLFPGSLRSSGNLVNILAHYVGYVFGFMVPALVSIYVIGRKNRFLRNKCYKILFRGRKNMKEHWWRIIVSNCGFKIAKYLFLIAAIFSIIGVLSSLNIFIKSQFSDLFLSIGFGLFTLTFGVLSLRIYLESDQLLTSIATGNFYEITYRFWDRAPILYHKQSKEVRDTQSWQLGNLFGHGDKLKKWAEPDVQVKLIKEFKTFLERLRPTRCKKYWVEVKNYMGICKIAIDFETDNDDIKNELIDELGYWIGKKEEGESNEEYLERKSNEFSQKKKYDSFKV